MTEKTEVLITERIDKITKQEHLNQDGKEGIFFIKEGVKNRINKDKTIWKNTDGKKGDVL